MDSLEREVQSLTRQLEYAKQDAAAEQVNQNNQERSWVRCLTFALQQRTCTKMREMEAERKRQVEVRVGCSCGFSELGRRQDLNRALSKAAQEHTRAMEKLRLEMEDERTQVQPSMDNACDAPILGGSTRAGAAAEADTRHNKGGGAGRASGGRQEAAQAGCECSGGRSGSGD